MKRFKLVLVLAIVVLIIIFSVENTKKVGVNLFFQNPELPLALLLGISMVAGAVIMLIFNWIDISRANRHRKRVRIESMGRDELKLGHVKRAVSLLKSAVSGDLSNAAALASLGDAYRAQGDLTGALECHEKALMLNPGSGAALLMIARDYHLRGDLSGSADAYLRLVSRFNPELDIMMEARDVLVLAQRHTDCIQLQDQIASKCPSTIADREKRLSAEWRCRYAESLMTDGDLKGAARVYVDSIKRGVPYTPVIIGLASVQEQSDALSAATRTYSDGLLRTKDMAVLEAFMDFCRRKSEPHVIIDFLSKQVDSNPTDSKLRLFLAVAFSKFGFTDEALRIIDVDPRLIPDLVISHRLLGDLYMKKNRSDIAAAEYMKAIAPQYRCSHCSHLHVSWARQCSQCSKYGTFELSEAWRMR